MQKAEQSHMDTTISSNTETVTLGRESCEEV